MVYYNCQGERLSNREATKSASVVMKSGLSKKCKKPLDKPPKVWYTIRAVREWLIKPAPKPCRVYKEVKAKVEKSA